MSNFFGAMYTDKIQDSSNKLKGISTFLNLWEMDYIGAQLNSNIYKET